jgi:zinc transporter 1/2/3
MSALDLHTPHLISRSACSAAPPGDDVYNTLLHVAALFIVLIVSTAAAAFPLLAVRYPKLRVPSWFFFIVRHFGTGVLIATAFCHLLPTAFASLNSPCLSEFWTQQYPAMPGAIALCGVFLVAVIEMFFHSSSMAEDKTYLASPIDVSSAGAVTMALAASRVTQVSNTGPSLELVLRAPIGVHETGATPRDANETRETLGHEHVGQSRVNSSGAMLQEQHKMMLQCALLEIGILFHSVFIGMALSVSVGKEFVVLLKHLRGLH